MEEKLPVPRAGSRSAAIGMLIAAATVGFVWGARPLLADGACSYQGKEYLNGSDVCQAGTRSRCENSVWHLLGTPCALQADLSSASCTYQGESFPSGRVVCQSGTQLRCAGGAWRPLGTRCGDTAVASFSGFFAFSVDERVCSYGGAQFQPQAIMCRDGQTFICERGSWADQGVPC